jgi:hypothetical protein
VTDAPNTPEQPAVGTAPRGKKVEFLLRLVEYGGCCDRSQLQLVNREVDRARQLCRKRGWAKYEGGYWRISGSGRTALAKASPPTDAGQPSTASNTDESKDSGSDR